jgi:predicted RNA-binding Zn-ribbon protein involved in translation (DUF1610 family)
MVSVVLRSNRGLASRVTCCPVCKTSRIYKRKSRKARLGESQKAGIYRCEECGWSGNVPEVRDRKIISPLIRDTRNGGVENEVC